MSLPAPNLDDRSFRDLVDEAIRLIPRYCPEWTHVGPSDPGIALLELYASMLESVLFRLNRLPEKNHLAFLSLLGVRRQPAQPARTLLVFEPTPQAAPVVPKGTRVSTAGADAVVFETTKELRVQPIRLVALVSAAGDALSDHTALLDGGAAEAIFLGRRTAERFLWLEDDRFAVAYGGMPLELRLTPAPGSPSFVGRVSVEAFDGKQWAEVECAPGTTRHSIRLPASLQFERLRLRPNQDDDVSELRLASADLRMAADAAEQDGAAPEHGFVGVQRYLLPIEAGRPIAPFGDTPRTGAALHLTHPHLLAIRGARLHVDVALVDAGQDENGNASSAPSEAIEPTVVAWECWNGRRWQEVGRTAIGPASERGPWRFTDGTNGLTRHGTVSFDLPDDLPELELGGVRAPWLRARLATLPSGAPVPQLESLRLRLTSDFAPVATLQRQHEAGVDRIPPEDDDIAPFAPVDGALALHFGFDRSPAPGSLPLHFRFDDETRSDVDVARLAWEAWDGTVWRALEVEDGTASFSRDGAVELHVPKKSELPRRRLFEHDAHWIRARVSGGAWLEAPRLAGVWVNAVEAVEGETLSVTLDSNGQAGMSLTLPRAPLLSIESVEVRAAAGGDEWIAWSPVRDLLASDVDDTHYACDPTTGEVRFGDGLHGAFPPEGSGRIRVSFRTGGGGRGNVGPGSLTVLRQSIPFVRRVTQPVAAAGGGDPESVDDVRRRGAHSVRSRDRAVTAEDFEVLAREASRDVARVRCLPGNDGTVRVVLVPRIARTNGLPLPSRALLDRVGAFLDERRLLTVRVATIPPTLVRCAVEVELSLLPGAGDDRVVTEIRTSVEHWLHPLTGGLHGEGWPFGRTLTHSELRSRIESVSGVDVIVDLALMRGDEKSRCAHIRLPDDGLLFLTGVEVRVR